jgi:uncharacterized protein (TIGR03086 family)
MSGGEQAMGTAALMADAIDGFGQRLGAVDDTHWNAPTPCRDWDVRTLANHVVGELLWVSPLLEGKTIAEVGDRFDGDVLGDEPLDAWASAAADARSAASQPGAQDRTVHLSFGDVPGSEYLGQVTSDLTIHSWDLAQAVRADDRLNVALVAFVDDFLSPQIDAWRTAGAFGPALDVGPGASTQDRLLAQTGRSSNWA